MKPGALPPHLDVAERAHLTDAVMAGLFPSWVIAFDAGPCLDLASCRPARCGRETPRPAALLIKMAWCATTRAGSSSTATLWAVMHPAITPASRDSASGGRGTLDGGS
jgi:hypothetical protein